MKLLAIIQLIDKIDQVNELFTPCLHIEKLKFAHSLTSRISTKMSSFRAKRNHTQITLYFDVSSDNTAIAIHRKKCGYHFFSGSPIFDW